MQQSADTLLLVRPSHFGFNVETATSNTFQRVSTEQDLNNLALKEFEEVKNSLERENIGLITINDNPAAHTPDAIFPNNWITLHHDGTLVFYPMESPSRRRERRRELPERLAAEHGRIVNEIIDLTYFEQQGKYLEGTGSLVFDHLNRQVYMAESSRSNPQVLEELVRQIHYVPVVFTTRKFDGMPVYHTNVMMSLGTGFAVVCSQAIENREDQDRVLETLEASDRKILDINSAQMASFAANILEVRNKRGEPFILLSTTALKTLNTDQRKLLEQFATLLPVNVATIENTGGGGVRCMVAEVFLADKRSQDFYTIKSPDSAEEMRASLALRWKILRKPWNQPAGSEQDDQESKSLHFIATDHSGRIAGTGRLQFIDSETGQVRYVAIDEGLQGKGIGRLLMKKIEQEAAAHGKRRIFLQARENAVPFYLSLGYSILEKTFLLYGEIQHFSMEKIIGSGTDI